MCVCLRHLQGDIADGGVVGDKESTHDHAVARLVEQIGQESFRCTAHGKKRGLELL